MSDFTKGKWELDNQDGTINVDGQRICKVVAKRDRYDECKANAHLIAAAPIGDELATAVGAMNFEDYDDYLGVLEIARRFNAKAEGE